MNANRMRARRTLLWAGVVTLLAAVSCNLAGGREDQTAAPTGSGPRGQGAATADVADLPPVAPQIVARRPYPGEEMPLDGSIDLYFDQAMDRQSVEGALKFAPDLPVSLSWVDDSTLRLTPDEGALSRATRYRLAVEETAKAANGLALEEPVAVDFQTVGFLEVGEVVPADGAGAVDPSSVITVFFNRPVVPLGIAEDQPDLPDPLAFSPAVEGQGEWINTSIYQFTPSPALAGAQTYTVTVEAGLEDQTGGVLEEPFSWEFSTLPPEVVSVAPAEALVPLDAPLRVEFNQAMSTASVEGSFTVAAVGGQSVGGSFTWEEGSRVMVFQPASPLPTGTTFEARIGPEALSASGQSSLGQEALWSFSTVPLPAVEATRPADGQQDADVWAGIAITFNAPVDEDSLSLDLLEVDPALPEQATTYYNEFDRTWYVNAVLEPSTDYAVTLNPGVRDPYGNAIAAPHAFAFTTAPLPPMIQLNTRGQFGLYDATRTTELFVLYRNVEEVRFSLSALTPAQFGQFTGQEGYQYLEDFSPDQSLRTWTIPGEGALNEAVYARVPVVAPSGGSLDPGIYLLRVDSPDEAAQRAGVRMDHFMLVVDSNLTFKTSFDESLLWLTDLPSGQPVEGVTATVYDLDFNPLGEATTGEDGVAVVSHPGTENLYDARYAIAEGAGRFAIAMNMWDEGVQPWQFGNVPTLFFAEDYTLYTYTERPIYRPGQTVYFKGVLRAKDDTTFTLPPLPEVEVRAYNEQGDVIYEQTLPLDEFGTFNGSLALDENAGLGFYSLEIRAGDLTGGQGFQVAEYRKPEYIVTLAADEEQVLAGDEIVVEVEASFFFGGPVSGAPVEWTVLSDQYFFQYDGPGRYSFADYDQDYRFSADFVPGFGEVIADGAGETDAQGRFTIRLPASLEDASTSRRFTIEAVVTDVEGQPVAGYTTVIVHKGRYYVGVSPDQYVVSAGDEVTAQLLALDWNAKPVKEGEVTVELVSQQWNSVREEDEFGRTQWTWSVEEEVIGDPVTVTTDGQGRAEVSFTPPEGGTYKIRAAIADQQGNEQAGSAFLWVSGDEFIPWRQANNDRIELVPDRELYQPGDTAELLVASPFQGRVQALITLERGSVISYDVITLSSNSTVLDVPLTAELAPNVFVSVVIVKGVDDSNPVPSFRMGLARLNVEPVEQTLEVQITPGSETAGPGEELTYTVRTADFEGRPVDAEVSLALVDLAVLQLAQPNSGPITEHFYGSAGLGVRTAVPLALLVDRLNQELFDQGKGGGGGGAEGFFEIRGDFRDTAYWEATVRTGDDGLAEVSVTLPDNLTTWRMDARAVTADTLVGQAEVDVVATKPLLVRPNTPRFFVVGDESTVSTTVNNNTNEAIEAVVRLDAQGATLGGEASRTVEIPANGRVEVAWPLTVRPDAEWVDLVFSAEGGGLSDASKPTLGDPARDRMLPVLRYEVPETVGTAGQLSQQGERIEGIVLPPTYDVQQGRVDVRIEPSLAAASLEALDYLEHFRYECTEQTVSRFLPNVLTLRTFRQFNLEDAELQRSLEEQVGIGLQRLYAQQHVDGGWGWFVQSESNPTVTAYVVQGLAAARDAGFAVEERVLADGLRFLSDSLASLQTRSAQTALHTQAYILYVMAEAGQPDVSRTVQLYEARAGMQHWARALVAQALWLIQPDDPRLDDLQSDLANSAILSATGAHWEEEADDVWNWNTDTRSTAIILDTYARLWPESDLLPNIVRWLMIARQGGHWETTQETAWALIGLADAMAATGELEADYGWTVSFNGGALGEGSATPTSVTAAETFTVPVADMLREEVNRLSVARTAGPGQLYYTAHLTAYLPVEEVDPLSRGVVVSRRYLDADGEPVTGGAVGDVITAEVTVIAPHDLYYLVVEDPYPAGAEAVDVNLQTESVLGERPTLQPDDPLEQGWGWWVFSQTQLRDEQAVSFVDYLPAGTYQLTYQLRLGLPGTYRVIPPTAREFYLPEVYGRGAGSLFTVSGAQ